MAVGPGSGHEQIYTALNEVYYAFVKTHPANRDRVRKMLEERWAGGCPDCREATLLWLMKIAEHRVVISEHNHPPKVEDET